MGIYPYFFIFNQLIPVILPNKK